MSPVRVLLGKELLDILRDRRTLALTLLLPIVLYPGLLILMGTIIEAGRARLKNEALVVAVVGDEAWALVGSSEPPPNTTFRPLQASEALAAMETRDVAAIVEAPAGSRAALDAGRQVVVTVRYTKRHDRSMEALDRLKPQLEALKLSVLAQRLERLQLDAAFAEPVKTDAVDVDFQKDLGPLIASRLLPSLLLMMLFLGALYPAVDLTAGERERGTLETLLVSAVRPLDIMTAKYLAVSLVATVTALANLSTMALTFGFGLSLGDGTPMTVHFSAVQVGALVAALAATALLASGVSLVVASLARTFKEGQSLMTPVLLVGLAPGLVAQMPGIELTTLTALVPLLNVALLVKAVVLGTVDGLHLALTVGSVAACALLAIKAAAWSFQREAFRTGGTPRGGGVLRQSGKT